MKKQGPIVIVDDDPDEQYLYRKAFEKLKLDNTIVAFNNGKAALDYLTKAAVEPFVILCDINMPLMTGLEMREEMCRDQRLCKTNTPFIFMSTSARPSDVEKASSLYTHGFFQKETSFEKHESLIKRIIDYWSGCRYSDGEAA